MNISLTNLFHQIHEAISLSNSKKKGLSRKKSGAYTQKLNNIFHNKDRIVFPLEVDSEELVNLNNPLIEQIQKLLSNTGVKIFTKKDYIRGFAYKIEDVNKKNPLRIGKLLLKINTPESKKLAEAFRDDPIRGGKKENELYIIISRHPYDIAGASTDRSWTSCMNLGLKGIHYDDKGAGINKHYIPKDIIQGSLIAYLVSGNDIHPNGKFAINRPLARILMKPFRNEEDYNDVAYSIGKTYGISNNHFRTFLRAWILSHLNTNTKGKKYSLDHNLYSDFDEPVGFVIGKKKKHNIARTAFFNELFYGPTEEKFQQNFEIEHRNGMYNFHTEIKIKFIIPNNISLNAFRYEPYTETLPSFIKEILTKIEKISITKERCSAIQYFEEDRSLILEYTISHNDYQEDDPKNILDEDFLIERMEEEFQYFGVRHIDYIKIRKVLIEELQKFSQNKDSDIERLKNEASEHFANAIKIPFFKNAEQDLVNSIRVVEAYYLPLFNKLVQTNASYGEIYNTLPHQGNELKKMIDVINEIFDTYESIKKELMRRVFPKGLANFHYFSSNNHLTEMVTNFLKSNYAIYFKIREELKPFANYFSKTVRNQRAEGFDKYPNRVEFNTQLSFALITAKSNHV